jgi:hypothetical protein
MHQNGWRQSTQHFGEGTYPPPASQPPTHIWCLATHSYFRCHFVTLWIERLSLVKFSWTWLCYQIAWLGSLHHFPVIQNGGRKTGNCNILKNHFIRLCFFASMLARNQISCSGYCYICGFRHANANGALVGLLQDETGGWKPKMATSEMKRFLSAILGDRYSGSPLYKHWLCLTRIA